MQDKRPYNDKGQRHGTWEYYYNGKIWYKGEYLNNQQVGLWKRYLCLNKQQYTFYAT